MICFSRFSEHFCGGDELPFLCYNATFVYGNLELDFCVYGSLVCDGKADCDNGEDEENCIRTTTTESCVELKWR